MPFKKKVFSDTVSKAKFLNKVYSFLIFLFVLFLAVQLFYVGESPQKAQVSKEGEFGKRTNETHLSDLQGIRFQNRSSSNFSDQRQSFYGLSSAEQSSDILARANAGLRSSVVSNSRGLSNPGGYSEPSFSFKGSAKSLPRNVFKDTFLSCGSVSNSKSSVSFETSNLNGIKIPAGFELAGKPAVVNCSGETLNLGGSVMQDFVDISVLRCLNSVCSVASDVNFSVDEIVCAGITPSDARKKQHESMARFVLPSAWDNFSVEKAFLGKSGFVAGGNYIFEFSSDVDVNFLVKISSPLANISSPKNSDFYFAGTPIVLKITGDVKNVAFRVRVNLPVLEHFDMSSLAFYSQVNNEWKFLDSTISDGVVVFEGSDLSEFLGQKNSVVLAVMGVLCVSCDYAHLEKIYDGGTRSAVVLVHGLFSSPSTWQNLIDDYVINKQPVQLWTLTYPSGQSVEETARQFIDELKLHDSEFDDLYFVSHSFGGFVIHRVLRAAYDKNLSFINEVRRIIMIGTPHQGTPILRSYGKLFRYVINSNEGVGLFDVKGVVADELINGLNSSFVIPGNYYVVAGNKSYSFDFGAFKVSSSDLFNFSSDNDGVTTVAGAQHMHNEAKETNLIFNESCENSFIVPSTHTDLTTSKLTKRIVSHIVSQDLIGKNNGVALLGYNRYVGFKINKCVPGEKYVIIGKKVSKEVLKTPNCGCGNNVCGFDETKEICPSDCAT